MLRALIALFVQAHAQEPRSRILATTDLSRFIDGDGAVQVGTDAVHWESRRIAVVDGMEEIMGELPSESRRVDLDVMVEEEVDAGTYIRQLITFQTEPGSRVPAYICVPKGLKQGPGLTGQGGKVPAVLCLHPTDKAVGHKVVLGLGGRQGRAYAAELAERGYVTISPAYPLLVNYWPNLDELGYISGTMKAIWDNIRALDLLDSLDYVDSSRGYAAIGHSRWAQCHLHRCFR